MAESLILNIVKKTWDAWNIRGLVLISLAFQVFLFLFSPLRKRTKTSIVSWSLWLAYLVADYVATFCIGLIFDKRENISSGSVKNYILVFWAPFLLLHLGGPDTITAFALEDNELWPRHLLGLVFQGITVVYVFFLTIPGNALWIPTVLVFVAGMIKYIERILSLYLASMDTLRKSVVHQKPNGPESPDLADLSKKFSEDPDVDLVGKGFLCFNKFKGLVVDMTYSYHDRNECRKFFLSTKPEDALTIIEAELGFMYEFFFTKETALRSKVGCFLRCASISSIVAAFIVFFNISDKKQHGFSMFEIRATYILFSGAVAQDIMALLMLAYSDRTAVLCNPNESRGSSDEVIFLLNNFKANVSNVFLKRLLKLKKPKWSNCKKEPYTKFEALSTTQLFRRWCGKIPAHDFIIECIHKSIEQCTELTGPLCMGDDVVRCLALTFFRVLLCPANIIMQVGRWKLKAKNPFLKEFWEFIFSELRKKSAVSTDEKTVKEICEARGAWTIQNHKEGESDQGIPSLMAYVNSDDIAFDESLIVWHIATNLCYYSEEYGDSDSTSVDFNPSDHRHFSKLLSDYMMYLLVRETSVTSAVAGIGQKRILEILDFLVNTSKVVLKNEESIAISSLTLVELLCGCLIRGGDKRAIDEVKYGMVVQMFQDAKEKGDKLSIDGWELNEKLKALPEPMRWKITAQVWVEMMSFAAINCRPDAHVQQLSKGGQLLSLVWLLMIHFGLANRQFQFQKTDKDHPSMNKEERQQPDTHEAVEPEITSAMNAEERQLPDTHEAVEPEITSAV